MFLAVRFCRSEVDVSFSYIPSSIITHNRVWCAMGIALVPFDETMNETPKKTEEPAVMDGDTPKTHERRSPVVHT